MTSTPQSTLNPIFILPSIRVIAFLVEYEQIQFCCNKFCRVPSCVKVCRRYVRTAGSTENERRDIVQ